LKPITDIPDKREKNGDGAHAKAVGKLQSRLMGVLSVAISLGLVTFLIVRMNFDRAVHLLTHARLSWLVLAGGAAALMPLAAVYRWQGVLRAQKELYLTFGSALRAVMFANLLNIFLPAKTGDLAKAVYVRKQAGLTIGMGTVILERLLDLAVLGAFGLAGSLVVGKTWGQLVSGGLLLGVTFVFLMLAIFPVYRLGLPPHWSEKARELQGVFKQWRGNPRAIMAAFLGSVAVWCLASFIVWALAMSLGSSVRWFYVLAIFPLAILAGLVPVTISGMGTRDSAFVFLLSSHLSTEAATLVGLGYTVFAYWLVGLIGVPFVVREIFQYMKANSASVTI
jgi:uncharacterized membrane protein YbhN (UPF0104 family)